MLQSQRIAARTPYGKESLTLQFQPVMIFVEEHTHEKAFDGSPVKEPELLPSTS